MVRKLYYLVLCVWLSTAVLAQVKSTGQMDTGLRPEFEEKTTPEERAKFFAEHLRKEFKLEPDTARAIFRATLAFEQAIVEQIVDRWHMTEYEKAIMKKLKEDQQLKIKQLLTAEQWEQYSTKLKKRSEGGNWRENKSNQNPVN